VAVSIRKLQRKAELGNFIGVKEQVETRMQVKTTNIKYNSIK
jgi:hypothetical protein